MKTVNWKMKDAPVYIIKLVRQESKLIPNIFIVLCVKEIGEDKESKEAKDIWVSIVKSKSIPRSKKGY